MTRRIYRKRYAPLVRPVVGRDLHVVSTEELCAKLGKSAVHVWRVLAHYPSLDDVVHITIRGIARHKDFVPMHSRTVKKALARLRDAGLVHDIGWMWGVLPRKNKRKLLRAYFRKVVVRPYTLGYEQDEGLPVPIGTVEWMERARTHGGKRPGSGRKPCTTNEGRNMSKGQGVFSRGSDLVFSRGSTDLKISRNRSNLQEEASLPPTRASARLPSSIGVVVGKGSPTGLLPLSVDIDGVPPFPSFDVVEPARVPSPPKLDPDAPDATLARELLTWYRAAVERRTGKPCHVLKHCKLGKAKAYPAIVATARRLIEHDIAPAAWVAFMLDLYRDHAGRKGVPRVSWAFAPERVDKWRGYFGRNEASYCGGGRIVYGKTHRELMRRYHSMRLALRSAAGDPRAVVEEWFPPTVGTYEQFVRLAQAEAARIRVDLERRAARGEFMW
jgi:hypothetical protein